MELIQQEDSHDNRREINYAGKVQLDDGRLVYRSIAICHDVEWACVTFGGKFGYGVYSWHHFREHAEHNARVTGGRAIPCDRMNGEVIIPSLAKKVVESFFSEIDDGDV